MRKGNIIICLIFVIIALSMLDAPAYVRCVDIGMCEFLEMQCHWRQDYERMYYEKYLFLIKDELKEEKTLFQDSFFLSISTIIRYSFFEFCPQKGRKTIITQSKYKFPLVEDCPALYSLKLVEISVILS